MKPNFKGGHPLSKHLFAVEIGKREITMNKPVYLGQAILDLSKMPIYQFHYSYMRPRYGSKIKLILTALLMRQGYWKRCGERG